MNIWLLMMVGILIIALIIWLVLKNQKDKKQLEENLNNDFHKSKDEEGDIEIDKTMK